MIWVCASSSIRFRLNSSRSRVLRYRSSVPEWNWATIYFFALSVGAEFFQLLPGRSIFLIRTGQPHSHELHIISHMDFQIHSPISSRFLYFPRKLFLLYIGTFLLELYLVLCSHFTASAFCKSNMPHHLASRLR